MCYLPKELYSLVLDAPLRSKDGYDTQVQSTDLISTLIHFALQPAIFSELPGHRHDTAGPPSLLHSYCRTPSPFASSCFRSVMC